MMYHWYRTEQWKVKVCCIPGDGNCLFSSLCHQLHGWPLNSEAHLAGTTRLREVIVMYIWDNRNNMRITNAIIARISDEWPTSNSLSYEDKVRLVLSYLSVSGNWGGEESLVAFMEIFNMAVSVYYQQSMVLQFRPRSNEPLRNLAIFYRLRPGYRNTYNHYDSVVEVVPRKRGAISQPANSQTIDMNKEDSQHTQSSMLPIGSSTPILPELVNGIGNGIHHELSLDRLSIEQISQCSVHQKNMMEIRIGCWNVRGANQELKRTAIDDFLQAGAYDVIFLQETKFPSGSCETAHYKWILGSQSNAVRHARGLAILVHKNRLHTIRKLYKLSDDVLACDLLLDGHLITIISVHIPDVTTKPDAFHTLFQFIMTKLASSIVIVGDFNAHLGKLDISQSDKQFIGPNLLHDHCNANGMELKNLIHGGRFSVKNTWAHHRSLRFTWTNSYSTSQIDHMLCNDARIIFRLMSAAWVEAVPTDHKFISATLAYRPAIETEPVRKRGHVDTADDDIQQLHLKRRRRSQAQITNVSHHGANVYKRHNWYLPLLQTEDGVNKYQQTVLEQIDKHLKDTTLPLNADKNSINDSWSELKRTLHASADIALPIPVTSLTPGRQKAESAYKAARGKLHSNPTNRNNIALVYQMLQAKRTAIAQHMDNECLRFFNNLDSINPHQRISRTYQFIRRFRSVRAAQPPKIPISSWDAELRSLCHGSPPPLLDETDSDIILPPPTYEQLANIITNTRNGTAPGNDCLHIELIKKAPPEFYALLHKLVSCVWIRNNVPDDWTDTTQVPLPKHRGSKTVHDFRRIALSSSVYKIYARHLLNTLQPYIGIIPSYQAGFLRDRSAEDHIFAIRRITEERWSKGLNVHSFDRSTESIRQCRPAQN